jgi:cytosolic prostaglandin-E synthase
MAALSTTNIPTCKWAQRADCVYVTVDIPDAKDEVITVADDKLTFKATSGDKVYECEMILFSGIDSAESKYVVKARNVQFYLKKTEKETDFWPRLLKDKALNKRFVKIDFAKWVDEDEEEDADDLNSDGMQGMGGMPGMGGMGGMPGMGGMGGMPGMGGGAGGMDMAALQKMMAQMGGGAGGAPGGGMPDLSKMPSMGGDAEPDSDDDLDDLDDLPDLEEDEDA